MRYFIEDIEASYKVTESDCATGKEETLYFQTYEEAEQYIIDYFDESDRGMFTILEKAD